jgi:seryl-tRNA(Sec) selenium transferase
MIKLYGRLLPMLLRARRGRALAATQSVESRHRVFPHAIDINLHLNSGRYLQWVRSGTVMGCDPAVAFAAAARHALATDRSMGARYPRHRKV